MRVTIDRLGHRGDGIAEGPVFVPGALPGEVVEGEVDAGRMVGARIVETSKERMTPDCAQYDRCGGCSLMHATDPFVSAWKIEMVRSALAAQGLPAPIRGIATSPPFSRRRAVLSGRRLKSGAQVGFHARRSDEIVGIAGCKVLAPEIEAAVPVLERLVEVAATRKGELSLSVTHGPEGLDVALSGARAMEGGVLSKLGGIAAEAGLARLTVDGEPVAHDRPPTQSFAGVKVVPPPGAFLQATSHGESALIACVSRALGDGGPVVDLFSGCGTFALPVSRRVEVHAVEGDAAMTEAALAAWRRGRGHRTLTVETRDLFRDPLAAVTLNKFVAAIVDPPRAGAEAQMREIAASKIRRVAAVSCNPITFARDAAILIEGGFTLEWVRVIDQFRWSPHVELAAAFERD